MGAKAGPAVAVMISAMLLLGACGGDDETTLDLPVERLFFVDRTVSRAPATTKAKPDRPPTPAPPDRLIECGEVQPYEPPADARPNAVVDLDAELVTTLSDYGRSQPESFAGLWLDPTATGGLLMAFSDGVEQHLERIGAELGGQAGQAPFSMVEVGFSEAELQQALTTIRARRFAAVDGGAVDLERNRVALELLNPSEEQWTELVEAVDPDQVCVTVAMLEVVEEVADGSVQLLPRPGGTNLLTCDEVGFPAAAIEQRVPLAGSTHPAAPLMAPFADSEDQWIVLFEEDERALYGTWKDAAGEVGVTALVTMDDRGWQVAGWTFGCDLKIGLPPGLGPVQIFADPAKPMDPASTTVGVLVSELACTGGRSIGNRLVGPEVIETDDEVLLGFAAIDRPTETFDCPTNPYLAVVVELAEPLGNRTVSNGMQLPPTRLSAP